MRNRRTIGASGNSSLKTRPKMDLTTFLVPFSFVFLAELGDKTQLAVITLCSKHGWRSILSGAMLAFTLIDGVSILIGRAISTLIPLFWTQLAAGFAFIAVGIYVLLKREEGNRILISKEGGSAFFSSFILVSLAEVGDKTQLAVIALAAQYQQVLIVFLGVTFAFLVVTVLGIIIGKSLVQVIPKKWLKFFVFALFVGFGVFYLVQSFFT